MPKRLMAFTFILGDESYKTGQKSVKTLKSYINLENGSESQPVFLVINSKITLIQTKTYTPRIIPISKKLEKVTNKSILLITKDPSNDYRQELTKKDNPTEDTFNQIISLKRLKTIAKDPKKLFKDFKQYDIIIADHRIHKFLPNILGAPFYVKNKKLPFMIQMAKPEPNAKLVRGKKSTKLKDNRCDSKYVYSQVKSIVGNTNFLPPANGNCISVKIGYTNWSDEELLQNIQDVLSYLVEDKYKPVGGLLKDVANIGSVYVKTSESISLPVFKQEEQVIADDNDSDFDF